MPTYLYRCRKCLHSFEERRPISDCETTICGSCEGTADRRFAPNANVMIPARFGLSRTWHLDEGGRSEGSIVSNGSTVHAPQRGTFQQAFDKNWDKFGRA